MKYTFKQIGQAILRKYLGTQFGRIHYLRLDINAENVKTSLANFDLIVKELRYEDFLLGNRSEFHTKKLDLIKERLCDPNYKAYGIIEDGRLIYSTWISIERLGLPVQLKNPINLLPQEGLLEDSYCDPIARGRGLHSKMNNFRIQKLNELGKTEVLVLVLNGNTPAFKVQMKSGFKELGSFYCGKILWMNFATLKKEKFDRMD